MLGKGGVITEIVSADNERTDLPASRGERAQPLPD